VIALVFSTLFYLNCGGKNLNVKIGDIAPDFELPDDTGNLRSLKEFRGRKVALYFYPKNDTPGCTNQACSLRDGYQDLTAAEIVILGISYDSPESHREFKKKYDLPFTLLSDENREVAPVYGASWGILGNHFLKRQTFLIDEQGILIKVLKGVDVNRHAQEVIQAFQEFN
jgi:peroxiredoxin Q/BCP